MPPKKGAYTSEKSLDHRVKYKLLFGHMLA